MHPTNEFNRHKLVKSDLSHTYGIRNSSRKHLLIFFGSNNHEALSCGLLFEFFRTLGEGKKEKLNKTLLENLTIRISVNGIVSKPTKTGENTTVVWS